MGKQAIIVIEYDINPEVNLLFDEAIEQVRQRMNHPDQPNTKVVQIYAAIDEDAQRVLDIFNHPPAMPNKP